ncbi:MAG: TIGR02757 family protein [Candidatus Latescibacteria bacterium]|jgi:uncharacterized protein (TIGR02757 family)|nr:TIGR02757 family protein [Candidatus Latescibacterota bacterium]
MPAASIKDQLDDLYHTFDVSMLSPDPLQVVRTFHTPEDREVAGIIAASLAYGRVELIIKALEEVFQLMDNQPYRFTMAFDLNRDAGRFDGFVYRLSRGRDIVALILMLQKMLRESGRLGAAFLDGFDANDRDTGEAMTGFVERLLDYPRELPYSGGCLPERGGVRYFLPSPRSGSACKRLNLFVRWMVRNGPDGIDLGLWPEIPTSKLIIPVDTHIARLARAIGLTGRKQPDWKMAAEITDALRRFDPDDPVKYDFALCHWGMRQVRGLE